MGAQKKTRVALTMVLATIPVVGGIITAIINGLFSSDPQPTTPPPPTALSSTIAPTTPVCEKKVEIKVPKTGARVDGAKGTEITGVACGLASGEGVWIFEYDSFDKNFYLVYDANTGPRPVTEDSGDFTIFDGPIGDPGDRNKQYALIATVGTSRCQATIEDASPDENDNYVFRTIPADCKKTHQVQILESQT